MTTKIKKLIRLQGYGYASAKPAGEFKPGEFILWNYGYNSLILSVVKKTAKTITFRMEYKSHKGIKKIERRFSKSRLVAISELKYLR